MGLALALGLVACAGNARWSKEGVSPQVAAQDLAACRSDAQAAMRRNTDVQADILASRGQDWQRGGFLGIARSNFAAQNQSQADEFVSQCMTGKGYTPAP